MAKTKKAKPKQKTKPKVKAKKKSKKGLYVNPDIVFREEGKEALLFDPNTGSIKVLNYVGKMIWKQLNGKNTEDSVIKKVAKKFADVDIKRIRSDVNKFLKELDKNGFLGKEI